MNRLAIKAISLIGALLIFITITACGGDSPAPTSARPSPTTPVATPGSTPTSESGNGSITVDEVVSRGESPFVSGRNQIQPGQQAQFTVGIQECCYFFVPLDAQVTWSVDPASGAAIDPGTGLFSVDATTSSGASFSVTADVEKGTHVLSKDVQVYTPEANPLVGNWQEVDTGNVNELIFRADGNFSVTWIPFEIRKDYWGRYTFNVSTRTLELTLTGGNTMPPDFDGIGIFSRDDEGGLVLADICLGTRSAFGADPVRNCNHRFR